MQHYEIVFLVHPDHSGQVPEIIKQYKSIVESGNGKVHRLENWGMRPLAYPIRKSSEAHYILMNIECTAEARKEMTDSFHFSDNILRNLILSRETAIVEPSPVVQKMKKAKEAEKARKLKQQEMKRAASATDKLENESNKIKSAASATDKSENESSKMKGAASTTDKSENESSNRKPENTDTTTGENNAEDTPTEQKHIATAEK